MDPRRELAAVNRHLDEYSRVVGDDVLWAPFDAANTTSDPVYDEPGARAYLTPVRVRTLWVNKVEADKRYENGERYDVFDHLTAAVSLNAIRNYGIPVPTDDTKRIYDLWKYRGQYWSIDDWEFIGRLAGDDTIIGIRAVQVQFSADFPFEKSLPIEQ